MPVVDDISCHLPNTDLWLTRGTCQVERDVKNELVESLQLGMEALKLFFSMEDEEEGLAVDQEEKLEVGRGL